MSKPSYHDFYLEAGHHSYKFKFYLPKALPSSFEHPLCRIRYKIMCVIKFQFKTEIPIQKSFSVLSVVNLNFYQNLRETDAVNVTKLMRRCCFQVGKLTSTLNVLKGGYVCGEPIVFSLTIQNNSSRSIKYASVKLIQKVSIQNKTSLREVASFNITKRIEAKTTKNVYNAKLLIPSICPTSNERSKLIKVNYFLLLTFKNPQRRVKQKLDDITIPIVIGTVPFAVDNYQFQNSFSYEPCIFGARYDINKKKGQREIRETNDFIDFRPLYAYYEDMPILEPINNAKVNYSYV